MSAADKRKAAKNAAFLMSQKCEFLFSTFRHAFLAETLFDEIGDRGGIARSRSMLEPVAIPAKRAALVALVADQRADRMRPARGMLAAGDAAHLVADERHARGRSEGLV